MKPITASIHSVRMPHELDSRLARAAKKLELSKNDIARHAIRAAVIALEAVDHQAELPLEISVKPPMFTRTKAGKLV